VNFQSLFSTPIIEQTYLDPGCPGHTNDVWRIQTTQEVTVLRTLRQGEELEGPFWKGGVSLFLQRPKAPF